MFKLIWSAILGGNPASWAILGLSTLLAAGAIFGTGYAVGAQSTIKTVTTVQAAAPAKAAAAQKKADDHEADRGKQAGDAKTARDAGRAAKLPTTIAKITPAVDAAPQAKDCVVPQAAIDALNEAGQ